MKRKLILNTLRSVKNTKSRFIAIMAIIAIGSGFFAGVKSASPDMKLSAAKYLDEQALADIHVMSDLGFDDEDVSAVKDTVSADSLYAGYTADLFMSADGDDGEKIVKVYSYSPDSGINLPYVTEGRLPEKADEIFADNRFFSTANVEIGDKISLRTGDDREMEDILGRTEYTVVGKGLLPIYVSFERGSTTIGNGVINGWILVPEENFTYEAYTDMYISLAEADGVDPYTDEYEEIVSRNTDLLEDFGETQIEHRKGVITDEAYEEINDAKAELEDGKKELADAEADLADGRKQLADAEKEIEDGKKEISDGEAELADGRKQLADAEAELADGRKQVADGESELADGRKQLADAESELADGRKQIADAEKELADGKKQLSDGEKALADARKQVEDGEAELEAARKQLAEGEAEYGEGEKSLEQLNGVIEQLNGILSAYAEEAADEATVSGTISALDQSGVLQADETLKQLIMGYMMTPAAHDDGTKAASEQGLRQYLAELQSRADEAKAGLDTAAAELETARKQIADGEAEMEAARKQVEDGEAELEASRKQIEDGEAELEKARREAGEGEAELEKARKEISDGEAELADAKKQVENGEAELADAKTEIADGEKEIADAKTEIADGEKEIAEHKQEISDGEKEIEDAKKEIADGEKEIADAEEELREQTEDAQWYVLDRDFNPSYSSYADDCDRVDAVAAVFPIFFILVAALVCCTTMTRMVEEQRTQIGTLKALGYSRYSIISQYVLYALAASIPGGFIGLLIGFNTIPPIIFKCYQAMYSQPYIIYPFRWGYALGCVGVACLCTGLSALYAARQELVSCPAQLMRPKPPKNGKRILLERVNFIWKKLKFTTKVTFRNLFRYKARLLMTVVGIAGCTGLLLTGYGLQYSITSIVDKQYGEIFLYDAVIALDDKADDGTYAEISEDCDSVGLTKEKMLVRQETVDISSESGELETYIFVTEDPDELEKFIDLHERKSREKISLADGVVLGEKPARLLGVKVGDSVYFDGKTPVTVTAICENYTFNYAYMTSEVYNTAGFENEYRGNMFIMNMTEVTDENEDAVSSELVKNDAVLAVSFSSHGGDKFHDLVSSLSMIIVVIIVAAGALAFVVLFNLSNININERVRELATIKVLGFYDGEVAAYVYRENILLTLMGTAAGLLLGIALEKFVIRTAEVDSVMFSPDIPAYCFLAAAALTLVFAAAVNITLYFRLKKIDMAASLKAIE